MLGLAVTLLHLLLLKGHHGQGSPDSTYDVVGLSGRPLPLRPSNTQMEISSVQWKMQLLSCPETYVILTWRNNSTPTYEDLALKHFNNTLDFNFENLTLLIKAAKPQDSGHYKLEVTNESGKVNVVHFKVFVFDHVEQPLLQEQWKALEERKCQVVLSCLVSRDSNVTYTWYRDNELISTSGNFTYLEVSVDPNDQNTYTCNVSNPVSWASQTLNLTQGCLRVPLRSRILPFMVIVIILAILFIVTFTCFCVRKRKRKQSQTSPETPLTIYEDVKNPQMRRNEQQEVLEEGITIYSVIQSQPSSSTSKEATNTLYSVIQPSRKSRCKERNHDPSVNSSIYEEVGATESRARNPARLSRKELDNFDIYS
ncbi:natural killer cell receptor 2B4 isoform X2 [Marmota monax]|uniref:natural killer cell receptor 2B4 isoform X2 n=1 Tax=Marmota monax TaxID=9995 RepID=UPI001E8BB55B|nr:natural killer cell receptor 2B4 isoform X2 [Marmota monax]KAI6050428.1 CD244 [Marmota monax]KAI6060816.1 CD244 [Marmota monax]